MAKDEPDIKADISAVVDRGESIGLMVPMRLSEDSRHRGALIDLALELVGKSAGFAAACPAAW
jgi:hypothetical protein